MADYSYTVANIQAVDLNEATLVDGTAGATITAGQNCYQDLTDGSKWKPAQANSATAHLATAKALHGALDEQPVKLMQEGFLNVNTVFGGAKGDPIFLSAATAGSDADYGDLTTGQYPVQTGYVVSATQIYVEYTIMVDTNGDTITVA